MLNDCQPSVGPVRGGEVGRNPTSQSPVSNRADSFPNIQPGHDLIPLYEERKRQAEAQLTFWMKQYAESSDDIASLGWAHSEDLLHKINAKIRKLHQPGCEVLVEVPQLGEVP